MRKLWLLAVFAATLVAQKKPITLESMNQGRGGGGGGGRGGAAATWAPDGKTFLTRQGRTLAIYNPATKSSRELVSLEALDNAAVREAPADAAFDWTNRRASNGAMQWSQDGKLILYSTGGDIFLIHAETGKWDQITKTAEVEREAKLSPDAKSVAFRRGFDLYTIDIETGKETRLTRGGSETLRNGTLDWVYPEELDLPTAFWWSPDSKSVVYMQFDISREPVYPHEDMLRVRARYEPQRYPQAGENNADIHLGVVPAAGGPTKWLEIGDTRNSYLIARAGWMPDSKSVYILRMNRVQNRLEMLSIGVESGASTTIFKESDPHWINLKGDIDFLHDGKRFLWTSERDGFRHIYVYSVDGKELKQATRGAWEVRSVAGVDEKNNRVFYTSTEASPLETHFYSVKLDGSDKKRLDAVAGTHAISMGPGGSYYLDTYSSLTEPPRTTLHAGDGSELGVYREADHRQQEEFEILPTEIVNFKTADGTQLYGRVIKPAGFQPGRKYPAIVSVYGGPGVALPVHNSWAGVSIDQAYAQHGYVVWQAENRGGQGRGHAFETSIFRALGPAELADQVAGVKYLISLGYVDPERIGIHGWSYGGFMTAYALTHSTSFTMGIAGGTVSDWRDYDSVYTERYLGLPKDNPKAYIDSAVPRAAANLHGDLLLIHGAIDDNVHVQNTMQLVYALQKANRPFSLMLYPKSRHGVTDPALVRHLRGLMLDYTLEHLKP